MYFYKIKTCVQLSLKRRHRMAPQPLVLSKDSMFSAKRNAPFENVKRNDVLVQPQSGYVDRANLCYTKHEHKRMIKCE